MSVSVPAGYAEVLAALKAEVRAARLRAHRVVNTDLLGLYWTIGDQILGQQRAEGWGTRVIDRHADDLRAEFPDMRGLSRSNLKYMRQMQPPGPPRQLDNRLLATEAVRSEHPAQTARAVVGDAAVLVGDQAVVESVIPQPDPPALSTEEGIALLPQTLEL